MTQLLQETLAAVSDNAWICHFVTEMCRQLNGYNGFPTEKVTDAGLALGPSSLGPAWQMVLSKASSFLLLGEGCWERIKIAGRSLGWVDAFGNGILPISSACSQFCPTTCQELIQGQSVSPDVCPAVPHCVPAPLGHAGGSDPQRPFVLPELSVQMHRDDARGVRQQGVGPETAAGAAGNGPVQRGGRVGGERGWGVLPAPSA